ncbi:hypothetical protein SRHO_G00186870 [Serrasalmus rhombeus]
MERGRGITELYRKDGGRATEGADIMEVVEDFDGDLYKEEEVEEQVMKEVLDLIQQEIVGSALLAEDFTRKEVEESMRKFKKEPLAQCLRRDTWVNGVSIPGSGGKEVKCVVYMDDMNIICTNEESVRYTMEDGKNTGALARFWMGSYLRKLKILKVDLKAPVAFNLPKIYAFIPKFFKQFILENEGVDVLRCHRAMRVCVQDRERPCPVPGLTEAQVEEVWRNAAHPALRNTHKDLTWLAAHEALPARAVMHSRGMAKTSICPRLGCGAPETVRHMLWECSAARDLWLRTSALWCPYLPAGGSQTLVYQQAVNGVGWSRALPSATFRELWPILNSVKDAIWESRNLLVGKRVEVSLQAKVKMVERAVQEYTRHASRRRALGPQTRKVEGATVPGCPQMHPITSGWSSGAMV